MLGRRKKKVLLHALLSFLFILVVFGAAWYFAVTYTPPTTQDYVDRSMTYLDDWSEELGVDAKTRESIYWDWIDENNTLVPLTGNEFYLGTIDVNGIGSYGSVDSDHLEKVNKKFFQPLLDDSDRYFDEKRFLGDKRNSREKEDDPIHTIHRGYQKGKMYCLLRLTPQSDPFGSLFCGTIDEEQKSLQKKVKGLFSSAYNPKNFTSFRVTKIENDFALGVT
ncbi:MAG: hypothetical protein Q8Q49_05185, partial [bacterium]|nr:hypothetical protein [bacterium]